MFFLALLVLLAAGTGVKCEQLTQPPSVTVQPGQRLTLTCQVSYSVSGYWTHWIRQPAGKGLEWIGRAASGNTPAYKDSLKTRFSISTDSSIKTVTLNGQNMQPEDTAVYYCARDDSWDYFDYWGRGTTVTVTGSTSPISTLFPLAQCNSGSGDQITLGCLAHDFSPGSLDFTWTDNSGTPVENPAKYISPLNNNKYTAVSVITVPGSKSPYRCLVNHGGNSKDVQVQPLKKSPTTTVKTPDRTTVKTPDRPIDDGSKPTVVLHIIPELHIRSSEVTLVCLVSSSVQRNYNITWVEQEGTNRRPLKSGTNFPAQQKDNKWLSLSVQIINTTAWKKNNMMFFCQVLDVDSKSTEQKGVSSAIGEIIYDVNCTEGMCHEVECSSLWSTTSAFIFLFIFSLLYNMILSLVKVKRS